VDGHDAQRSAEAAQYGRRSAPLQPRE
jgi:hypothetical protein